MGKKNGRQVFKKIRFQMIANILPPERYDLWLDPQIQDTAVMGLLRPFDAGCMRSYPVSARLNSVGNDDAECSTPIEPVAGTPSLFD